MGKPMIMLNVQGDNMLWEALFQCGNLYPEYQCEDCFGIELCCSSCTVMMHKNHPLHWLQVDSDYFKSASLKSLGLQIQLSHALGHTCSDPCCAFNDDFHWIFVTAIWDPKMAAMFRLLEEFYLLSFESKVSAYEFYYALMQRFDNTGISPIKNRYNSFMRMIREWSHDPNSIDATTEGACAVPCPACLQPGKHLPSNWREAPPTKSWLYGLSVAINANFWLKCKESAYKAFLNDNSDISQEVTTTLVNMADTKSNCGLAAMGLGAIDCARHNMKLLTAVRDLQKGEKYINMDYLFFLTLQYTTVDILNVSYDIACQWNKNLWHCMTSFPPSMRLNHDAKKITFFVPKFHLPLQIQQCQTKFLFNFAPSRGWANINPMTSSTKEMGPGMRRDTLDDFFGDWNWRKITGLQQLFLQREALLTDASLMHMKEALPELSEHKAALDNLEEGLKEEYSEALSRWKEEVKAWEYITLASVCLKLAKEEALEIELGGSHALHEDCSLSMLISSGLELEEQQRRLTADKAGLGIHATNTQEGMLIQHSNSLQHQIKAWVKVQELYMPMLAALRWDKANIVGTATCDLKFQAIKWKLRYAQAHNTLCFLCSNLHAQTADACKALVVLASLIKETGWQSSLQLLNYLLWGQTEERRKLSWIWNMWSAHGDELGNDRFMEDIKIKWCKARAHAMRWKEEVELLWKEMRRILQFFDWQAMSWDERMN
ncbi:uncharacterized protein EDB93DRAFT_1241990 [Suillus bovinus]|uniref:uncharacterized protein n=1 Tax=Suillus bovinus TaxID=48563 RepID=UPI001B88357C|nr:uncharacterized protein EDB93DRAFT_1241990 [Suillus bovinus]KAG2139185.1 hypothetical protein EDB93DRAFT_1241990 [Suillus bovinus]